MKIQTILDYIVMFTVALGGIYIIRSGAEIETSKILEVMITLHGSLLVIIVVLVYIIYAKISKLEPKEK